jgi:CRISPR-associated endonuclease/helicase Cas3
MERAMGKAERLMQIEALLVAHPQGLHKAEIARRLGVHRSTIGRCIEDLSRRVPIWEDDNLVGINREDYLTDIRLTIHESMAVHLATRLIATRMDKHNPHAAAAMRKLGQALEKFAPQISRHVLASADVMDDAAQRHDPVYLHVLETLTRAWSDGRVAHVWHRLEDGRVYDYDFAPYFIEPYAVGQTTHVIGWREPPGALRTFKLERIQRAELTDKPYTIPADFEPRALLADAWGIWYTEAEPVEVALRFHPRVAGRVRETRWHRSERVEDQPDGSLIWQAQVAEPQEMLPWIRGWGADCEVLEPEALRKALADEARQSAALYQVGEVTSPSASRLLWAKADRKTGSIHRLIYHLIDVGQVALAVWQTGLDETVRHKLADWLGLKIEEAGHLIAFWASLHDLGKASPAFQDHRFLPYHLKSGLKRDLELGGLRFRDRGADKHARHEVISTWALDSTYENLLASETELPAEWAKKVAQALGGHHGAWPASNLFSSAKLKQPDDIGETEWTSARRELIQELKAIFQPPLPAVHPASQSEENAMLTWLSAIVSVADWLGSDEKNFGYEDQVIPPRTYARYSKKLAGCALRKAGWADAPSESRPFDFQAAFGFAANAAQREAMAAAAGLIPPALVILEAPMGSGKTEAALAIYAGWAKAADTRGLYVAMPTTATSNQMHGRARAFLKKRYGETVEPLLVHSQAMLRDDVALDQIDHVEEEEGEEDYVASRTWFLPRKKSLLVPFGVGTVDQALMSVLQTKHFFVRLLGLSHKVVVFDEVHAYDMYMNTLFQRLLHWLREIGTSVIVLSATLPEKTRRELVKAYTGREPALPSAEYPRLTYATAAGETGAIELSRSSDNKLALEWMTRAPAEIVSRLRDELRPGGCAAVICNTVRRAQEIYEALEQANRESRLCEDDDLILFHARYPLAWREGIEDKVLRKFGKDRRERPKRAIVVATQVIEQSLDLDFDVMISDVAPVDLLLQRAGRLHRHAQDAQENLIARCHPYRLWITLPDESQPVPVFDKSDLAVYGRYLLLGSWAVLRHRKEPIHLPRDLMSLIESVYDDGIPPDVGPEMQAALKEAFRTMRQDAIAQEDKAEERLVRKPSYPRLLWETNMQLEEDNAELHQAFQALTRDTRPSVSLVCLHQTDKGLALEPDGTGAPLDIEHPDKRLLKELARRTVNVQHDDVVYHFLDQKRPWRKVAALRYHRLAVFANDTCPLDNIPYVLQLTHRLGLRIIPCKEAL